MSTFMTVAVLIFIAMSAALIAVIALLQWRNTRNQLALTAAAYSQSAGELLRQQWIADLPFVDYRNEIEVEIKFIAPLVTFLGFTPEQIDIRVPITVQIGRQTTNGQADWVLWAPGRRAPIAVIEAKGPTETLGASVLGQARSYAFALNAPLMVLTNGRQLDIYRRGVQSDQRIVTATIDTLAKQWPNIVAAFGQSNQVEP